MSDKSFGDCPSRNIVKNPLLSTAVTGLSIEDLTHNAVLIPVAATQGLITGSEHQIGSNNHTLGHSEHDFTNFPSGDSNTNVFAPQTTVSAHPLPLDNQQLLHSEKKSEKMVPSLSKASLNTEDDFDVNEYFARLHGTRYVSAPINSNPDENANLAAEDNLEEINLNDDKVAEPQQSLTADIAQNFSQLPTVLPHVASAVFSSFSNMLNYKSREQTPDDRQQDSLQPAPGPVGSGFVGQNLSVDTSQVAEEVAKDVAPPPKEMGSAGASSFRITSKKRYAQIPGLSSGTNFETLQKIELNPLTKNVTNYFVPSYEGKAEEPVGTPSQTIEAPKHDTYDIFSPKPEANPSDFQSNAFNISMDNDSKSFEERLPPPTSYATQGNATIPPPPMFSSQRTSSQSAKSVLPPSVARRIGSNHPVIKPQTVQTFHTENIFVPTFDPMAFSNEPAQPIGSSFGETPSQSFDSQIVTQQPTSHSQDAALANVSSIPPPAQFTQPTSAFTAPPEAPPTQLPPQTLPPPPSNIPTNLPAPPMFAPTQPTSSSIFAPPKLEDKSKSAKESVPPNIFAPTPPTQVPPGPIKPPTIGPTPNIGPPTFFSPPPVESAPIFYSTDNKQVQPSQQYVSQPPKPLVEPPKATGAVNYRLNKKRPQYYSGPIEGVGSISNSIKPIIAPVDPVTFHGAMFTPQQPADLNVPSSIPFDLSKPAENEPLVPPDSAQNLINAPTPVFDISQTAPYQHFDITNPEPNTALYNTAFDLSRPTTENYEPVEQKESKGFGIIGSLKSKLSSIDINKIQHSVTTFFDPAYNDTTKQDFSAQQNVPYANNPYQAQTAQTNLEIFVPGPQQNIQQYPYDYQHQSLYSNNEYYRYPNFQNQGQPAAGHCSNEHHYPSHSQHPKAYDNSQHGYGNQPMNSMFHSSNLHTHGDNVMTVEPTNVNNSNVMTYKETQDFNAEREMDANVARAGPEVSRLLQSTTSIEERFATNFFHNKYATAAEPIKQTDETPHNIPPIGQDRTTKDSFDPIKQDAQVAEPVAMFNPDTVNLFANLQIDSKDDIKQADKTPHNIPPIGQDRMFTKDSFQPIKPDAQVSEPVAMFNPNTVNLFGNLKIDSKGDIKQADKTPHNIPPIGQDRTVTKEFFEPIKQDAQVAEPVAMFNPNTVNLFANLKIDSKDDSNEKTKNTFTTQSFKGEEKQDISTNEAQSVDLFANIKTDSEEKESKLFPAMDIKASVQSFKEDTKPQNLFPFEKKEISSSKDNLLDSLTKDDGMILGVSSVPLFGLSPMVVEQPKDAVGSEMIGSLPERNASTSFFEHSQKLEDYGAKHADALNPNASFSFFENVSAPIKDETQELVTNVKMTNFFDNSNVIGQIVKDETLERKENIEKDITADIPSTTQEDDENASELSICETCREVNKPEDKEEDQDVTSQLIENITAPIQLSNPVEATLTETPVLEPVSTDQETFNAGQFEEISHITEETIETIQVQSAIELLDDVGEVNPINYGWNESALKEDYNFNVDTNQIGFFGKSSLFFDKGAATEEIENEKNKLVRQMSVPSAPPAEEEEDSKSDETGVLDVNSIEQDAKKDFPLFEEFVIEPSENDDDNFNEQERSEGVLDSFTDRIEKYKSLEPSECGDPLGSSFFPMPHPIGMSSYFDTGNYAVEAHYRNTNTRPAPALSIPPGFEEEYKRRLALAKQREENLRKEMVVVPDTSTQTKTTSVATYCASRIASSYNCPPPPVGFNIETNLSNLVKDEDEITPENLSPAISQNVLTAGDDKPPKRSNDNETKLPEFVNVFGLKPVEDFDDKKEKESSIDVSKTSEEEKVLPTFQAFGASKPKTEEKPEEKLPDPINFFSDTTTTNPPESFSRLASYFSSPPKTDHAKSFFELSQSQNHYRHATSEQKSKINDLIKDLTSVQNISPSQDQIIKHVNYFTVEYDTVLSEFKHGEVFGKESADLNEDVNLDRDFTNCRYCTEIVNTSFTVKTAINTTSDQGTSTAPNNNDMDSKNKAARGSVTVSFDGVTVQEDNNLGILSEAENRSATEYSPVLHHWFYRVDVEDKSIWRGFSVQDSRALENAFLNPNLTENTMVATDGGRYDVNIVGRLRIPVYWTDKPTNVRRCSWFYKGTTDARYVPYTEAVAEKLEEEYRHGMTTAEWHRRLVLPNGEVVVMHGPSVMVHFLHSENAFSTPPQSSCRPRVVRRGHDESEIEDTEPSSIDHLLLLCHGVGSACDMRFRSVEEVVEDFRTTSLQLIQSHYRNSYDQGIVSRVEVLPISWHATLHSGETGVDRRLSQITLDSIPRLRSFTNETVLDVLFYTSPVFCQTILDTVCKELNRIYELFLQRNPDFKGGVSLGGHSLGSVILYDLLCHQNEMSPEESRHKSDKNYVHGPAGTGQPAVRYPQLLFAPAALYALGSPIAIFECIRGVESLGASFSLPTCKNFFNIFHPYDPIAYRIEPLINPVLRDLKPSLIPHHKGRKRMHLELKDTMARVGADLKQKLLESLRSTWNKWKTQPTEGQLEKVVEEELEKEQLTDDSKEEMARERELSTPEKLGRLNGGRRIDYVLQEAPLEMINEYLFAMSSHVGYWESEDTMLLILREIYSALGVQPDSTVPQQNMTVQRTRPVKTDETIIINNTDTPSTSRGPI